jgi:hypothetical protein
MSDINVAGAGAVQMMSLEGLDLESMLMAVQTNRVNLLDQQLKDQMGAVQNRNNRISELNVGMNGMNKALVNVGTEATDTLTGENLTAFRNAAPKLVNPAYAGANATTFEGLTADGKFDGVTPKTVNDVKDIIAAFKAMGTPLPDALKAIEADGLAVAAGRAKFTEGSKLVAAWTGQAKNMFNPFMFAENKIREGNDMKADGQALIDKGARSLTPDELTAAMDACQSANMMADPDAVSVKTRAGAEVYIKSQQGHIDALGNTQQMDMLRLQSLSNKRNEAFEIMTNFMKKLADSRSGIIAKF